MMKNPERMPVVFIGHGSPMNAIEDNAFTDNWRKLGDSLPRPKAILVVSAHWYVQGTKACGVSSPRMIYDMYGFPEELYQVVYPAPGSPGLARKAAELVGRGAALDDGWGFDHGAWSVLARMYPGADIPAFQLSVDSGAPAQTHFDIGRSLSALRDEGVLILGSGNVVHNLAMVDWEMKGGYPWALEFDGYVKARISERRYDDVIDCRSAGGSARSAFSTPDHFYPLLYVLGASEEGDRLTVLNDECVLGSLSMTCYVLG
jgi:4,5-DOPA dioxygenase extradiol